MAFETGGRADKLGNRHEGWWVAKQLLRLLKEEITSVTIEAVGDDEQGVDVWIEEKNGVRQAQQCKARNGSKEGWSVNELKSRDILSNLQYQLDRKQNHEFAFVSAVPCTILNDICESARNSAGNPESFYFDQIQKRGKETKNAFITFCNALFIDQSTVEGRQKAFNYLSRTKIILFSDDENTRYDLRTNAGYLLTGEPEFIITSLITYAENNYKLGSPIYVNDLYAYFKKSNITAKNLVKDSRIVPVIENLQREFDQSIKPLLINGELIPRSEAEQCMKMLDQNGLVIITGDSGVGKSGVLYEVTSKLQERRIPYIPLRVDRRIPKNTARQYGIEIGLPDSPAHCLSAIGGGGPSVLIIDQLDAIRWTSAHSSNALDVCKEIINQVMSFRRDGKDIRVILSCRSFDLNFDVELKNWLEGKTKEDNLNWGKIEVGLLTQEFMSSLLGETYSLVSNKQKKLLSRPQNLYMWFELISEENKSTYLSSIDLIRGFWNKKLYVIEKEGIKLNEVTIILDNLLQYIERKGSISVPSRILSKCSRKAITSMKSNGIIREQGNTIIFSHQSYLDFLIAEKIVIDIDNGKSIGCCIGSKENQNLFRREQLRQALIMVWEENLFSFADIAKDILVSQDVRFHLKHLVLEVIGNAVELDYKTVVLLEELLENPQWKSKVLETVFIGNATATKLLIEKEIIQKWLHSGDEELINTSINLLSRVKENISQDIINIFTPLIDHEEQWQKIFLNVIGWDSENDSEDIFKIRLILAENKIYSHYVNWGNLARKHPLRAIQYISSILKSYSIGDDLHDERNISRLEKWYKSDLDILIDVAQKNAIKTWDMLINEMLRLIKDHNDQEFEWEWNNEFEEYTLTKGTRKLLVAAGQQLAADFPEEFINRINLINSNSKKFFDQIIGESIAYLNVNYADFGVAWLLKDPNRLILGDGYGEYRYQITRNIIKSLSPYCKLDIFKKLEELILSYHEPDELRLAKRCFRERRNGFYWHYWGQVQYLLLTQLYNDRISKQVVDLISVLKRRYKGYSKESFMRISGTSGGSIGSKLDRNMYNLNDKSWLRIVKNKKVPKDHKGMWTKTNDGTLVETSIWQFARNLETVSKKNPERFGKLALQFPVDVDPKYIVAILRAFELDEFNSELVDWKPACPEVIMAVLNKYLCVKDNEISMAFCRLVKARVDIEWPLEIIEKLMDIAVNHPDPRKGTMNVYNTNWDKSMDSLSAKELFNNSINCVRGVAVESITHLLWRTPKIYDYLQNTITKLVKDPHPSVRMSVVGLLIPILNIDRDRAVNWFYNTVKEDLRTVCTMYGISFISYTIKLNPDLITKIVISMIKSKNNEISKLGSEMVGVFWIFHDLFTKEVSLCCKGSAAQKQGIVKAAVSQICVEKYAERCEELLRPFIINFDPDVIKEMSDLFKHDLINFKKHIELILKYIKSPYFKEKDLIIHQLNRYTGSLIDFSNIILNICEEISEKHSSKTRDISSEYSYIATELSRLLLRLYGESTEVRRDISNECLDMWDKFFEKRIGSIRELTKIVEEI
jgi:hypothetical protein